MKTSQTIKRLRWLLPLALAVVIVVVIAVARLMRPQVDLQAGSPVFPVAVGPLTISVTEAGTIKPREQVIIKNELEGRTTILYLIPEGTRVTNGQLLVELDASALQDQKIDQEIRVQNAEASFIQSRENLEVVKNQAASDVDKAELDLRFAREDLTQYKEGEFPNTLKEHEAKITLAEEELQRVEQKLKWSQVLFDEKYLAETELKADELAVNKARLDLQLATNNLALLKEYTYTRSIDEMESNIKQAEMALERVRRKASADIVQAEADLRAKDSEFKRQSDKLDKIEEQIGKARIVAPRDGLVVYATSAEFSWRGNTEPLDEGQEVRERQELIHLPTASTFLAELKVHESNLEKIKPGLPVRITVDALPGQRFSGTVTSIAPLADPMSMFMNPDLKLYNTQVTIDGGSDVLRTGMSCEAEIIVERYDSAMYVPVQCIVRVNGQPTAFVKTASGTDARAVRLGLDNNRMVHILDGLEPGENVLLAPPLDLAQVSEDKAMPEAGEDEPQAGSDTAPVAPAAESAKERVGEEGVEGAPDTGDRAEMAQKMRERFENMSPEEREAWRKRMQQRRGQQESPSTE